MLSVYEGEVALHASPSPTPDLITELYSFAVAHARASACQPTEADDFLQEILIVFLEVGRRYELEKEELIKVAKTAARNRIRDLVAHRNVRFKYHVTLDDVAADSLTFDEESLRIARDTVAWINRMVNERTAVVLSLLSEGHSMGAIADRCHMSKASVSRIVSNVGLMTLINLDEV